MKKILSFLLFACFVAACSGNPPAWWNPNNRYGTADGTPAQEPAAQTPKPQELVPSEEELEPLPDTTYEEVTLTPMADEENENKSGAPSAQQAPAPGEEGLVPSVLE